MEGGGRYAGGGSNVVEGTEGDMDGLIISECFDAGSFLLVNKGEKSPQPDILHCSTKKRL